MKKRIIIIGLIALIIIAGALFFWNSQKKAKARAMMEGQLPQFPTALVERGDLEKLVYAPGSIEEGAGEEIKPEVSARVKQVFITEGQEVKAGDLLFTLDDTEVALSYSKESLAYEIQSREMNKELAATAGSAIYAPGAGEISEVLVENGAEVEPQTIVAKYVKTDLFEMVAPFNVNDVKLVQEGQAADVFLQDFMSYVQGTVVKVDRKGRSTPGGGVVYNVTVEITNPGALEAGNKGAIEIKTAKMTVRSIGTAELTVLEAISIKSGVKGKISQIHVDKGDAVDKGSLLISLDAEGQKNSVEEKRMSLEQARLSVAAKAQELAKYKVYAGVSGKVIELNVTAGGEVPSDKPAVVIANLNGLKMQAKVEEEDIPLIQVGQEAQVYVNAYGDKSFAAVVSKVAEKGKVENSTVTFEVELSLKEPGPLKPGMTGSADIIVEKKTGVLRLPPTAVSIEDDGRGTVMVKGSEGQPEPKPVVIGIEGYDYIEIVEGLSEGDEVLLMQGMGAQ